MNTKETILNRAAEIIAQHTVRQTKDRYGTLITIDPDGLPRAYDHQSFPQRGNTLDYFLYWSGRAKSCASWPEQEGCRVPELSNLSYFPHRNGRGLYRSGNLPGDVV